MPLNKGMKKENFQLISITIWRSVVSIVKASLNDRRKIVSPMFNLYVPILL
jgi:hypothetical protein